MKRKRVLVINSDVGGCYTYRVEIPFTELKTHGYDYDYYAYLPSAYKIPMLDTLLNFIYPYDIVILQRCHLYEVAKPLRQACDILGKRFIFETDDDYIHLPPYNPAFKGMDAPGAMAGFKEILRMADAVTVTTEELAKAYYPYNKNMIVLPNNVERVHYFKDCGVTKSEPDGSYTPIATQGFVHIPSYVRLPDESVPRIIRLGYTGTPTHRVDFETIKPYWFKAIQKYGRRLLTMYMGDEYFFQLHKDTLGPGNVMFIPPSNYHLYYMNIRNLDIGIAPLQPDVFNMGKSPIKAIEYASWGIPAVLPNYVTYEREFTANLNCLMYYTGKEFYDALCTMIEDFDLRIKLGNEARSHVAQHRLECVNSPQRAAIYNTIIEDSKPIKMFERINVKQEVST